MHIAGVVDTKLIDVRAEVAVGMRKRELLSSHSSTCAWVLSSFGNSSILQGTASRARHCCCLAAVAGCSQCVCRHVIIRRVRISGMNTSTRRSTGKALNNNGRIVTNMSEIVRTRRDCNLKRLNLPEQAVDHIAASNGGRECNKH